MFKRRRRQEEQSPELNLIPVMNLFVCLVPFLLLTAAFVKLGGIHAEMPSTQTGELQENKEDQTQIVDLVFQVNGSVVEVAGFTQGFRMPLADVQAQFATSELDALDAYLTELSEKYPKWGATLFKASHQTRFEDAVSVLGALRESDHIKNLVLAAEVVE